MISRLHLINGLYCKFHMVTEYQLFHTIRKIALLTLQLIYTQSFIIAGNYSFILSLHDQDVNVNQRD